MGKSRTPSPAQTAASRENGKKSRGPRTDAGKQHSRMNALKRGYYSESLRASMIALGVYNVLFRYGADPRRIPRSLAGELRAWLDVSGRHVIICLKHTYGWRPY